MRKTARLLLAACCMLLSACQAEGEFSTWPCRFGYDNGLHLDATLASAMEYNSRGVFCKIWESASGGVAFINFQNNHGMTSSKEETAMERQASYVLGLNNGIIVGFPSLADGFVAYDAQCPNCVRASDNYVNPKFPVAMTSTGIATCQKCGRKYDLNNGGIIQNGEKGDVGLEKYLASTTGPQGYIAVGTKR